VWGVLSDERTGISFTVAAGPRQRTYSRVWVPCNSWPYFTVSDSSVRVTLRLAVYRQSIRLGANPLRITASDFFFQMNPCGQSLWNILSGERMGLSLMNMLGLVKCTCRTHSMLMKLFAFALCKSPLFSPGFAKQIMSILLIICYNDGLVIGLRYIASDRTTQKAPHPTVLLLFSRAFA
jgi:hypothetical protein